MKALSTITALFGIALVVASGYVHGSWTGRWQSAEVLARAADAVQKVPQTIGDWDCVKENQLTSEEVELAEIAGYVSRQYRNRRTSDVVNFVLMCGKPGPISVHPPTACYTGLGYQQVGLTQPYRRQPQDNLVAADQFHTARFESPQRGDTVQPHIYWAWTADGRWQTPESPRLAFVGSPALFKMYVSFEAESGSKPDVQSPAVTFLDAALPVLQTQVFGKPVEPSTPNHSNP